MNWGALNFWQVAGLSAVAAAVAVWLYLRQPRAARLRVSTLRFWESAPSGSASARRRKLREPLALLAQILFLILLMVALGNPRLGVSTQGRSVAIVVDAGAWSEMRTSANATWLNDVRAQAQGLLQQLPSDDRILLLRADSDGAALVPFTTDHSAVRYALANLGSSSAVADVPRALEQARSALTGGTVAAPTNAKRGLLVYIGPGLMDAKQAAELDDFRQSLATPTHAGAATSGSDQPTAQPEFLVRLVGSSGPLENIGITQIALKRSAGAPDEWSVMTQVRDYNDRAARVMLSLSVGGHVFRQDELSIAPNSAASASDDFTSRSGGLLQAEVTPSDDLPADNRATIVLPSSEPVPVAVVSSRANFDAKMRAVLSANPYVKTDFLRQGEAVPSSDEVVIYDGPAPVGDTASATISFVSPAADSSDHRVRLANWNSGHPVTRWIESRDVSVRAAGSLKPGANDVVLASTPGASPEPLIVAHESTNRRSVAVDFDPIDSNFTDEPAFPLLMAASIEWMTHPVAEQGDFLTAGSVDLPIALSRIVSPSGSDVLFASDDSTVHFFAGESGLYRVTNGSSTLDVPVNVPVLPTIRMAPTASEIAPLEAQPVPIEQQDLWRWLVALAMIALWLEWRLFYFRRDKEAQLAPSSMAGSRLSLALGDNEHQAEHSIAGKSHE
jgi:hypothetical protein